ncbi:prepilin-type N-terminal cleavage/methylation domain-containing protein [Patescibacteria group bacterium]|nr:prepilin-type N-terminal cleavage/methylation domain-containing protein [Patescibacteria group bacterium]
MKVINSIQKKEGFTLIELLISVTVLGILSVIGLASYVDYSREAALESARASLKSTLYDARSRALSQKKPASCTNASEELKGFRVVIWEEDYKMQVVCNVNRDIFAFKKYGINIRKSDPTTNVNVFFPILTGAAGNDYSITLESFGKTKKIIVNKAGTIKDEE